MTLQNLPCLSEIYCLEDPNEVNSINTSRYLDVQDFGNLITEIVPSNHLSILNTNSRSLARNKPHYDLMFQLLKDNYNFQFDIMTFDETWLNSKLENLICFDNYTSFMKHKTPNKEGGGLAFFLHKSLKFKPRNDIILPQNLHNIFDCLFIEVTTRNDQFIVGLMYRSPSYGSIPEVNTFLQYVIETLQKENKTLILVGDLNINLLSVNDNPEIASYLDLMLSNNLLPAITLPTRVTSSSATLIDHIFTNAHTQKIISGTITTEITDHFTNFIFIETLHQKHSYLKPSQVSYRPITNRTIAAFNEMLSVSDWSNVFNSNDPSDAYTHFITTYINCLNQAIPLKTCQFNKYKHKSQPWITKGLLISLKTKDKLHSKIHKCPNPTIRNAIETKYKQYRNIYNSCIRKAKILHWHKTFENSKNDIKKTWTHINSLINNNNSKTNFPTHFINNDSEELTDNKSIANAFNNYFINVGPALAQSIDATGLDLFHPPNIDLPHSFNLTPTSPIEIMTIIDKLKPKTSTGHDDISPKLIKSNEAIISELLCHISNLSFITGKFPDHLKLAKVIPIYKCKDNRIMNNYRPISLLPSFSKIFERLVYNRLYRYLKNNNLLTNSQFGFQKGVSTETAILELQNEIINKLNRHEWCIGIFLDLSKAFDTLDHNILLHKLSMYGIRGVTLDWFRSYLSNRKQYTVYRSEKSLQQSISCGVPQGSILGPLLFLIYINDIINYCNSCVPILFADDTNLIFSHHDLVQLFAIINAELNIISNWFKANKLSINTDKTKFLLFQPQNRAQACNPLPNITINGEQIEQVPEQKFLGVYIDQRLNWKYHINHKNNQLSRNIGVISRLKNFLPCKTLQIIYNSIIMPHLSYGVIAWGNTCKREIKRMSSLQKRAIRIIHKKKFNSHTGPLFKLTNSPTLEDLYVLQCCKLVHKKINQTLHPNIAKFLSTVNETHNYPTRHSHNIRPHRTSTNLSKQLLSIKVAPIWNALPEQLKSATNISLPTFTNKLKEYLISKYPTSCTLNNCFVCNRPS